MGILGLIKVKKVFLMLPVWLPDLEMAIKVKRRSRFNDLLIINYFKEVTNKEKHFWLILWIIFGKSGQQICGWKIKKLNF